METRLAEIREEKGMRQAELARRIGLSRGQVANLESGNRKMDLDVLRRCANVLECSVVDLLLPEDAPNQPSPVESQILFELRRETDYDPRVVLAAMRGVIAVAKSVHDALRAPRERFHQRADVVELVDTLA